LISLVHHFIFTFPYEYSVIINLISGLLGLVNSYVQAIYLLFVF